MFTLPMMSWNAVAVAVLCAVSPAMAVTDLNLNETFADIRQQIANSEPADILVLGDSLSFREGSYLPYLRDMMQSEFGDAGYGYQAFSVWSGAGFNQGSDPADPAWTLGLINQDTEPHLGLDGLWAASTAPLPDGPTNARFSGLSESIELHYLAQPGGGAVTLALPGGGQAVIDTDSTTAEVRTWSYQFTTEDRTIWFQPDGTGPVTILGQNNTNNTPGVRLHRVANGGWGVDNYLARDETFDEQLQLINPGVVAVWLGQNDQGNSAEQYLDKVNQLVDQIMVQLPESEVLLIGNYDSGSSKMPELVQVFEDIATSRSLGFINLYELGGDNDWITRNGLLDDGVHFSDKGGAYFADLIFQHVFPAMMPAWNDTDADGFIGITDLNTLYTNWNAAVTPGDRGAGDLDGDGFVGIDDLSLVLGRWNESTPGTPMQTGDIDRDGLVGITDLNIMLGEWNASLIGDPLAGDVDNDDFVGISDLGVLLAHWNTNTGADSQSLGDLDGDGFVGITDLNTVLANWNAAQTDLTKLRGDLTGDSAVGIEDLNLLMKYWGQGNPPPTEPAATLPEPTGVAMLVPLLCLRLLHRRAH